ncbi:hypothetical protein GVX82_04830 [Patescibacteria group bacterium]|jgi:hypothetical protein|nr:hypothetical protein [Patescibacteria group bacterium]
MKFAGIVIILVLASVVLWQYPFGATDTARSPEVGREDSAQDRATSTSERETAALTRSGEVSITLPAGWSIRANPEWEWEHEVYDDEGRLVMITHSPIREVGAPPRIALGETWEVESEAGDVEARLEQVMYLEENADVLAEEGIRSQADITSGIATYTWRAPDGPYDESVEFLVLAREGRLGFASTTSRYTNAAEFQTDRESVDAVIATLGQ